jgi:phosphoserine phosphatase
VNRFASVVLDVDSTLSRIEGIEWLSARRDPSVSAYITETTDAAMRGDIPLEAVYGKRLALVNPTWDEIKELGQAYIDAIAPGARETIAALRDAGVRVTVVSGGILEAVLPLAAHVGVLPQDVRAVSIRFDACDRYIDYDQTSPLARRGGKPVAVRAMALSAPTLALGDGITDAELKATVDRFVAFTGVTRHARVVELADAEISRFDQLLPMVLP